MGQLLGAIFSMRCKKDMSKIRQMNTPLDPIYDGVARVQKAMVTIRIIQIAAAFAVLGVTVFTILAIWMLGSSR